MKRRIFSGKKKGILASVCLVFSVYLLMGFSAGELVTRVDFLGRAAGVIFSASLPVLVAVFALLRHSRREWALILLMTTLATALTESAYLGLAYSQPGGFSLMDSLASFAYLATVSLGIYLTAFVCGRLLNAGLLKLRKA